MNWGGNVEDIKWSNERRKLAGLVPWEHNPRHITESQAGRLEDSLDSFGQIHAIAIGPDGEIYDGHQRSSVWAACSKYGPDYEVDVRVASRSLTDEERQKLVIYLHAGASGGWDWDKIAAWDAGVAAEWGLDDEQLKTWNNDAANLREMRQAAAGEEVDVDELWQGMPEFEQEAVDPALLTIKVHFATEADIKAFAELVGQTITMKTTFLWYPKKAPADLINIVCADES